MPSQNEQDVRAGGHGGGQEDEPPVFSGAGSKRRIQVSTCHFSVCTRGMKRGFPNFSLSYDASRHDATNRIADDRGDEVDASVRRTESLRNLKVQRDGEHHLSDMVTCAVVSIAKLDKQEEGSS